MTDDLVKQLRALAAIDNCQTSIKAADRIEQLTNERDKAARLGKSGGYKATPEHSWAEWCDELYRDLKKADGRIEQLEAALRFYAEYTPTLSAQDFRSVARAALEGKD